MEWRIVMNKYKIVALFGPAGAGKDYIQKHMMETTWGKEHLHEIISYTTRPPREREIDGVNYYFLSNPKKLIGKDLLEYTIFRNWWYGTPIDSLNINKINIGVFNLQGIKQLINNDYQDRLQCLPIYIKTNDKIRLMRQLNREQDPDCTEICRRFQTDQQDFLNINFPYHIIENNTNEFIPIEKELIELIESYKWS